MLYFLRDCLREVSCVLFLYAVGLVAGKKNITQKKGKIDIKLLLDIYLDGLAGLINLINREDTEDKSFRNSGRTYFKSFMIFLWLSSVILGPNNSKLKKSLAQFS